MVAILKQSYECLRRNNPIIVNRILLAFGINPDNDMDEVNFETYRRFMQLFVLREYSNQEAISYAERVKISNDDYNNNFMGFLRIYLNNFFLFFGKKKVL